MLEAFELLAIYAVGDDVLNQHHDVLVVGLNPLVDFPIPLHGFDLGDYLPTLVLGDEPRHFALRFF